jgi:hypothetical protein
LQALLLYVYLPSERHWGVLVIEFAELILKKKTKNKKQHFLLGEVLYFPDIQYFKEILSCKSQVLSGVEGN